MFSDLKEMKFNDRKYENSNNDTNSTIDSVSCDNINSRSYQLVNSKLLRLLRTDISEDSKKALEFISNKFGINPIKYLTDKSVVLLGNNKKKFVAKFIYKFTEELKADADPELEDMIKNERNILSLKHKNIMKVSCYYFDIFGHSIYVSDFLPNLDLKVFTQQFYDNKITKLNNEIGYMNENLIRIFATQMIDVLVYLDSIGLVHGNLTPSHFLVHSNFLIRLIDFSCSRYSVNEMIKISKNIKIDIRYMPKEYFEREYIDFRNAHKIDVFSLGCILYYLATNEVFEMEGTYEGLRDRLMAKLKFYSTDLIDLIYKCLDTNYLRRINIYEVKEHVWTKKNSDKIRSMSESTSDHLKLIKEMIKSDTCDEIEKEAKTQLKDDEIFIEVKDVQKSLKIRKGFKIKN